MKSPWRIAVCLLLTASVVVLVAQDREPESGTTVQGDARQPAFPAKATKELVPLNREGTVLLDAKRKLVVVDSQVALREGMLEMLLCKKNTKEHESILAFDGKAYIVHAGLVALGIDPGGPVTFQPEYIPPTGPRLKIELVWTDEDGKEQRADARQWIRYAIHRYFGEPLETLPAGVTLPDDGEMRFDATNKELSWYGPLTEKSRDHYLALSNDEAFQKAIRSIFKKTRMRAMDADWVFVGSRFVRDEADGHRVYLAESGDVVCVANFPSAMIDVDARSSAEGQDSLLFEAWTERIPPVGTPVRIEISKAMKEPDAADAAKK
ncbi:MAG: YdjY domain-containing protein [Planctomycetaceae bacterium]